jgi:pectinesterase
LFGKLGGYFTAPSPDTVAFGYVFYDCRFIGNASSNSFYLGRLWRPCGSVHILNSEIAKLVKPEGWNNWSNPSNEQTARFTEYNNFGERADRKARVPWIHELSEKQALKIDRKLVLRGWDPMTGQINLALKL